MRHNGIVLALLLAQTAVPAFASTWQIDSKHSSANFRIKHMMVSNVHGTISGITGKAEYDGKNVNGMQVNADLDVKTINTNEPARDEHLRGADFFDVAKYPTMTFRSKKIEKSGNAYKLIGDLTMHGVTKEVALNMDPPSQVVKDPHGREIVGTTARGTINRQDFGIKYNKTLDNGGLALGDDVEITLDVELAKDKETAEKSDAKHAG